MWMNNIIIPPNADAFWLYYPLETARRRSNTPFWSQNLQMWQNSVFSLWYGKWQADRKSFTMVNGFLNFHLLEKIILAIMMLSLEDQDKRVGIYMCNRNATTHMVGWIFCFNAKIEIEFVTGMMFASLSIIRLRRQLHFPCVCVQSKDVMYIC